MRKSKRPAIISDYFSVIGSRGGRVRSERKLAAARAAMARINAAKKGVRKVS